MMSQNRINPLIQEKLQDIVNDDKTRQFIEDILMLEKDIGSRKEKKQKYEKALSRYIREE